MLKLKCLIRNNGYEVFTSVVSCYRSDEKREKKNNLIPLYVTLNESLTGLWKFSNNRIRIYAVTAALNGRVPGNTMAFYFRRAAKENTGEEKGARPICAKYFSF